MKHTPARPARRGSSRQPSTPATGARCLPNCQPATATTRTDPLNALLTSISEYSRPAWWVSHDLTTIRPNQAAQEWFDAQSNVHEEGLLSALRSTWMPVPRVPFGGANPDPPRRLTWGVNGHSIEILVMEIRCGRRGNESIPRGDVQPEPSGYLLVA